MDTNNMFIGIGVRKPRFRKPTKNYIKNRILMAVLFSTNTKLSQLSTYIGVSSRSTSSWIYERTPSADNQDKIAEVLNFPKEVLFYPHLSAEYVDVPFDTTLHQGILTGNMLNIILAGLMMVHDINHLDLAQHLGYNRRFLANQIHLGHIPAIDVQEKVSHFFKIPHEIIYNPKLFRIVDLKRKDFRPHYSNSKLKYKNGPNI